MSSPKAAVSPLAAATMRSSSLGRHIHCSAAEQLIGSKGPRELCTKKVSGTLYLVQESWTHPKPKVPDTFFVQSRRSIKRKWAAVARAMSGRPYPTCTETWPERRSATPSPCTAWHFSGAFGQGHRVLSSEQLYSDELPFIHSRRPFRCARFRGTVVRRFRGTLLPIWWRLIKQPQLLTGALTATARANQLKKSLLLFRAKDGFLRQKLLDDQFLHFPLTFEDLLLFGDDCGAIRGRRGNQVDEFPAQTIDGLALLAGTLAEFLEPGTYLLDLRLADADSLEQLAIAFFVTRALAVRECLRCPGNNEGAVQRHGKKDEKGLGHTRHGYSPGLFESETSIR